MQQYVSRILFANQNIYFVSDIFVLILRER